MSHSAGGDGLDEEYVGRRYASAPPPLYPPAAPAPVANQRQARGVQPPPPLIHHGMRTPSRKRPVFWIFLLLAVGLVLTNAVNSRTMNFGSTSRSLPTFTPREFTAPEFTAPEFTAPSLPSAMPIPELSDDHRSLTRLEPGVRIAIEDDLGAVGTIRLLETSDEVDCDDAPTLDPDEMIVGLRLSVISLAQTEPLPITATRALALDGEGEQVNLSPVPGCHADEIEEVAATGQPHEGWVTVRVDRSAETIAWEYGDPGDLVVVEINGTSDT